MQIDNKPAGKHMKQALTKEKTIVTNLATLWVLGLLLLSLSAGWFNLTNQTNNLEQDVDTLRAELVQTKEDVRVNAANGQAAQVNLAEINTRLTSIDATLIEIKSGIAGN